MATPQENKRTDSIRVRLAPEMLERFEDIAKRYGMPPATLGAFAIAKFVQHEENSVSAARTAVMEMTRRFGDETLDGGKFDQSITATLTAMIQNGLLPLDGVAAKDA